MSTETKLIALMRDPAASDAEAMAALRKLRSMPAHADDGDDQHLPDDLTALRALEARLNKRESELHRRQTEVHRAVRKAEMAAMAARHAKTGDAVDPVAKANAAAEQAAADTAAKAETKANNERFVSAIAGLMQARDLESLVDAYQRSSTVHDRIVCDSATKALLKRALARVNKTA